MTNTTKIKLGILVAHILFICSMIDMRETEKMGTCEVNGFIITPVSNHDCKGYWHD